MEQAAHGGTVVRARLCPTAAGGHDDLPALGGLRLQRQILVMRVTEIDARLVRGVSQHASGPHVVGHIGRQHLGHYGNPDDRHGVRQVQLPAVDPAVPIRRGLVCFGVGRSMWEVSRLAVARVLDRASRGAHDGAVDRDRTTAVLPWLDASQQLLPEAGDLGGERIGDGGQASLDGARRGIASCFHEHHAQVLHDHDDERSDKAPIGGYAWATVLRPSRWWQRDAIDQRHEQHKGGCVSYHLGVCRLSDQAPRWYAMSAASGHPRRHSIYDQASTRSPHSFGLKSKESYRIRIEAAVNLIEAAADR